MGNIASMTECCCIPENEDRNNQQDRSILNKSDKPKRGLQYPYESDNEPV